MAVIYLFGAHRRAAHHVLRRRRFKELLISEQLVHHEGDVVCPEWVAVGPFGAGAQGEGVFCGAGVHRPAFRQVGHNLGAVDAPARQALVADNAQNSVMVGITAHRDAQGAAIATDLVNGGDHLRLCRQALQDGWQLALIDQRGQFRRLMIIHRQSRSRTADRQQGGQAPCPHPIPHSPIRAGVILRSASRYHGVGRNASIRPRI